MKWILLAIFTSANGHPGFSFMGEYADKGGCTHAMSEVRSSATGFKQGEDEYKLVCVPSMAGPLAPRPK